MGIAGNQENETDVKNVKTQIKSFQVHIFFFKVQIKLVENKVLKNRSMKSSRQRETAVHIQPLPPQTSKPFPVYYSLDCIGRV